MTEQHLGMVVEEDGQVLIAFKPETIKFISDQLTIEGGDVVVIDSMEELYSSFSNNKNLFFYEG